MRLYFNTPYYDNNIVVNNYSKKSIFLVFTHPHTLKNYLNYKSLKI